MHLSCCTFLHLSCCQLGIEQRQLDRPTDGIVAVEAAKCKYGKPRAFVRSPVTRRDIAEKPSKAIAISSGMLRLSCPHLVKAIDEMEATGGIEGVNDSLQSQSSELGKQYRNSFLSANTAWKSIRAQLCTPEDSIVATEVLGAKGFGNMMESGIIGVTLDKTDDAKCLHAHTADYLLRDGDNLIGKYVIEVLASKGIDSTGCVDCWQQCDKGVDKDSASWWYMSVKNKEKLRQARDRRRNKKIKSNVAPE